MGNTGLKLVGAVYGGLAASCGAIAAILGKAIVASIGTLSLSSLVVCASFTSAVACTALFSAAVALDCFALARAR